MHPSTTDEDLRLSFAPDRFLRSTNDPCARAAARLDACGLGALSRAACDPDAAAAIADLSCEALSGDNGFCSLSSDDRWMLLDAVDPADVDWLTALRTGLRCVN